MHTKFGKLQLIRANKSNVTNLTDLAQLSARKMQKNEIKGAWSEKYPALLHFQKDFDSGGLFKILLDEKIIGGVCLNQIIDESYNLIDWKDKSGGFLAVHRLFIIPEFQGKGLGKSAMQTIHNFAKSEYFSSIRLDTNAANSANIAFYIKLNYQERGFVNLKSSGLRVLCFEFVFD